MMHFKSWLRHLISFLPSYIGVGSIAAIVLVVGTVFYHYVEHWRWLDAVYFCVVTLATIGYGDFAPRTDIGKVFTIFYALIGLGILGAFVNTIFQRLSHRREQRLQKLERRTKS